MSLRVDPSQRAGDYRRMLRETLGDSFGPHALLTVTGPGSTWEPCACCGRVPMFCLDTPEGRDAWNRSAAPRFRDLRRQIRLQLRREYDISPPIVLARVAQRQARGVDHLHMAVVARADRHRDAIRRWVELYRRYHIDHGFGYCDDPYRERRGKSGRVQTMVFERGEVMGSYMGGYLTGGQFESFLEAPDTSFQPVWLHRGLLARTGWSLERCRWLRQAYLLRTGQWRKGGGGSLLESLESRYPSWWFVPSHKAWVLEHSGWDGSIECPVPPRDGAGVPPATPTGLPGKYRRGTSARAGSLHSPV